MKWRYVSFSVLIILFFGSYFAVKYHAAIKGYEKEILEYQDLLQNFQSEMTILQSEKGRLDDQIVVLQEEKEAVRRELESLTQDWEGLNTDLRMLYLMPPESGFLKNIQDKKYMTGPNVPIRKAPSDNSAFNGINTLSYDMVDIIYAANTIVSSAEEEVEEGIWILVQFHSSEPEDTLGWVRWKELIEYTDENKHLLHSPVKVSKEAIDLDTGKPVDPLFYSLGKVRLEEDYATIHIEGGLSCRIEKKYVIYPEP